MHVGLFAARFDDKVGDGRNGVFQIEATDFEGKNHVDVFLKTHLMELGKNGLCSELIASNLANRLNIPVNQGVSVFITESFISVVPEIYRHFFEPEIPAFGSIKVGNGWFPWTRDFRVFKENIKDALRVLVFDIACDNFDRKDYINGRKPNPNLLTKRDDLRGIDHDMCFGAILRPNEPNWDDDIAIMQNNAEGPHCLWNGLKGNSDLPDMNFLIDEWNELSSADIHAHSQFIPPSWQEGNITVQRAVERIATVRDNISNIVSLLEKALS